MLGRDRLARHVLTAARGDEGQEIRMVRCQFARILDPDQTLTAGDRPDQGIGEGRLARRRAPRHDDVLLPNDGLTDKLVDVAALVQREQRAIVLGHRADIRQVLALEHSEIGRAHV